MFPFDIEDEELEVRTDEEKELSDYEIDFETGKLTGRIITGLEAIRQWVKISLTTERYLFPQYSWNHGSDFNALIGQGYDEDYINTEVKRMISEVVSQEEAITGFDELKIEMKGDRLSVSFVIDTIYGRGDINV